MTLFDLPRPFVLSCLFIFGCCFGSFLNVCIHRFPSRNTLREQLRSLASHSSGCPRCSTAILWRDNIPLLGWLLLAGRCRNCKRPISFRYPLVECLTGCLFVLLYQLEMPPHFWSTASDTGLFTPDGPQNLTQHLHLPLWLHVRYLLHIAMICCLIAASFIDLEHWIIPDGTTVPMMGLALATHTACGQAWIVPLWFQDSSVATIVRNVAPPWLQPLLFSWDSMPFAIAHPHWHGFLVSLAGLLAGGGVVWTVRILGAWVFKREAMGFGDVVLMAMIGSVLGWQPVLVIFFLAPVPAIAVALVTLVLRRRDEIPYGPWLSLAALILLLAWRSVGPLLERIFDLGPLLLFMAVLMVVLLAASLQLSNLLRKQLGWTTTEPAPEIIDDGIPMIYPADKSDPNAGQWPREFWPGVRSGQGLHANHLWRYPR
ncbi:MAG: Late competence protein ComC [Planctomycetota bacterium]